MKVVGQRLHLSEHVIVLNQDQVLEFCGNNDEKIRFLQSQIDAKIVMRGNKLKIIAEKEDLEKTTQVVLEVLRTMRQTGPMSDQQFRQSLRFANERARQGLGSLVTSEEMAMEPQNYKSNGKGANGHRNGTARENGHSKDYSRKNNRNLSAPVPNTHELFSEQIDVPMRKKRITALTQSQKNYIEQIRENVVTFGIGPAGTGKTYLAMAMAAAALNEGSVSRIILCRPAVEAGERLGFLPGDLAQKFDPYVRPLWDALYDMMDTEQIKRAMENNVIEIAPLAFMRGRTLSNAFVILDEGQNTTTEQMKMFLTRLGQESKAVVTGDITQVDLPRGQMSGLLHAQKVLSNIPGVGIQTFERSEVVRHPLLTRIIEAYENEGKNSTPKKSDRPKAIRGAEHPPVALQKTQALPLAGNS